MFDFEWTGRAYGDETDRKRGIAAALTYCADNEIDPAQAWADFCDSEFMDEKRDAWNGIEWAAVQALAQGWQEIPENVSLIWN